MLEDDPRRQPSRSTGLRRSKPNSPASLCCEARNASSASRDGASRDRSNIGHRHNVGSKVVLLVYGLSWLLWDRRLLHLADLVEGSVWQVDAFVADDHKSICRFLFNFDQGNAFLELRAGSVGASIVS